MFKAFVRCFYPNQSTKSVLVSHVRLLRSADGKCRVPFSGLYYPYYWNFWTNYTLNLRISRHSPIRHSSGVISYEVWSMLSWNGNPDSLTDVSHLSQVFTETQKKRLLSWKQQVQVQFRSISRKTLLDLTGLRRR